MTTTGARTARPLRAAALAVAALLTLAACSSVADDATLPASAPGGSDAGGPDAGGSDAGGSDTALSFSAVTLTGEQVDVADLAGEPVMLWFWAPWCTICRVEAPEVARVAAELDGQVAVLGVPGLGPEDDMREFVDATGTGGIAHLVDSDGSLWQRFGVVSQPAYAFVAPDGSVEVFAGALGGEELRARAESLAG